MAKDRRRQLSEIKQFKQLITFLRDEMGWPIDAESDFDDLTYEYTTAELGIDEKSAAQIQDIKRLRPLSPNQPWGVFFVKFEPKKLPVIALRRILSQVALKKRASANPADRSVWAQEDLLFISNYGEGDDRQITLAHFSAPSGGHALPTLKVLGWDSKDTVLHLEAVARELTEQLSWPSDESNVAAWRAQWSAAFTMGHQEVITTSKALSIRLAQLARDIRDRISAALAIETKDGPLTKLMKAFQESLIHDLTPEDFADMYAQTITYGLLSSRIVDPKNKSVDGLTAHMKLSPFLKELMATFLEINGRKAGTGIDFDELGVGEVVELLDRSNMEAVVADFGDKNAQEDPVMHFFEGFLEAYNKEIKRSRGVFYTPQPVVSYIVRSVHELLQTEFGLADGLADTTTWGEMLINHPGLKLPPLTDELGEKLTISPDEPFVQILDPATGTATFLVEVIEVIHRTLMAKWQQQRLTDAQQLDAWNDYVPQHLLPRLHAFELMMAPYAIAHMKIGLKLAETGYRFGTEERARIYLTNALEPWTQQQPLTGFDALAHEAAAVSEIKMHKRFTVVIGNPPYSNFGQQNKHPFILNLLEEYKHGLSEKKLNLDDDYIKFIRLSQYLLNVAGAGVIGMITNNSYLDGVTHRSLRLSLINAFTSIFVLNLHGSTVAAGKPPDRDKDENVFDIQQGVSVVLQVCSSEHQARVIRHYDCYGSRQAKYALLSRNEAHSVPWVVLTPSPPNYFFKPQDLTFSAEYQNFHSLSQIFSVFSSSIKTERDQVSIHWTHEACREVVEDFRSKKEDYLRTKYLLGPDSRDWKLGRAISDVQANTSDTFYRKIMYRPFDIRHTWYSGQTRGFIGTPGYRTMRHMIGRNNLSLIATRLNRQVDTGYFFVTKELSDIHSLDNARDSIQIFPLYTITDEGQLLPSENGDNNFSAQFLATLAKTLNIGPDGLGELPAKVSPEDIFNYLYAVLYSRNYRKRYAEFLKIEYPRVPLTHNQDLFYTLARIGKEVVSAHLLESSSQTGPYTEFAGDLEQKIETVRWSKDSVWLNGSQSFGFTGVPEAVWNFYIGGYQVCEKWLKDRKGRTLSHEDITHYQKIVVAISETLRLMDEIDEAIEHHGGWPGAFSGAKAAN
jgi:predicted helicase